MFDFFKVQKVTTEVKEVKEAEDFENIDIISEYFKDDTGIDFDNQKVILKSKVKSLCRTHKISSFKNCLVELQNNSKFKQEVIDYLTTNESFFYREFHQIEELVKKVKSAHSSHVNILCAPCANGEEPYSIAIALFDAGVSGDKFNILGIDISSAAVDKSKAAVYNTKAIRNLSSNLLATYFEHKNDLYYLSNKVKRQVSFKRINIFEKEFKELQKFDYIFSRNMLIYFDYPTRRKAHTLFTQQLKNRNEEIFFGHADLPNV